MPSQIHPIFLQSPICDPFARFLPSPIRAPSSDCLGIRPGVDGRAIRPGDRARDRGPAYLSDRPISELGQSELLKCLSMWQ